MRRILFYLVLLFLIVSLVNLLTGYMNNLSFYNETKKNLNTAIEKNKQLLLQKTTSNSSFEIEKNLRNKTNLIRKGEIMVIVPSPTSRPTPVPSPATAPYRQWLRVFFQ